MSSPVCQRVESGASSTMKNHSDDPLIKNEEPGEEEIKSLSADNDHIRHKRRRRGKKRKFKTPNGNEVSDNCVTSTVCNDEISVPEVDSISANKRPKCILIRPVDVPKAPENFTQFLIDDHANCGLYFSFETPNPYLEMNNAESEDAAFQDIDYKYESPQDLDNSAFYTQDFEDIYSTSRMEILLRLSRSELIPTLEELDARLKELEDDLVKYDPSHVLEQLQQQLLHLQEENEVLTVYNTKLKSALKIDINDSGSEHSPDEGLSGYEEAY